MGNICRNHNLPTALNVDNHINLKVLLYPEHGHVHDLSRLLFFLDISTPFSTLTSNYYPKYLSKCLRNGVSKGGTPSIPKSANG
jgi:hypothetical protein